MQSQGSEEKRPNLENIPSVECLAEIYTSPPAVLCLSFTDLNIGFQSQKGHWKITLDPHGIIKHDRQVVNGPQWVDESLLVG